MPRLIIQSGTVITPEGRLNADVLIENGKIRALPAHAEPREGDQVIDASGLLVMPGIVDAHTHIQLDTGIFKTADNWEVGTRAAAAGGVTTVIDFANQIKGKPFSDALAARCAEAAPSLIDYTFHMVVLEPTSDPEELVADLRAILDMGITSLKLFTTYRPNYYIDDASLLRIFRAMPPSLAAMVHCENDSIVTDATARLVAAGQTGWHYHPRSRPPEAEIEAISRVLRLATMGETRFPIYIAHCSTAEAALDIVRFKQAYPGRIHFETCPQYLILDDSVYEGSRPEHYILQPPLRAERHRQALRNLARAGLVDVLSTDTCDYSLAQKQASPDFTHTPGGLPGIETMLPLMLTLFGEELGQPLEDTLRLMTANPARIFGLYPRKGALQVGSDADIVLYNPQPEEVIRAENLHYLAGYNPYEGMRARGKVRMTISRGDVIYQDGKFPASPGRGQFVRGEPLEVG